LLSIQNQTINDYEIIIIDDGSTDDTVSVINSFNYLPIKYYKNEINSGISFSRNKAALMSSGRYIAILDSDDECLPDRLSLCLDIFEKNKSIDIVIGNVLSKGDITINSYEKDNTSIFTDLFFSNPIIHSTVMIKRILLSNNLYDKEYDGCEDYDLWTRVVTPFNIYRIENYIGLYNSHSESITNKKSEEMRWKYYKIVFKNLCKHLGHQFPSLFNKLGSAITPIDFSIQALIIKNQLEIGKNNNPYIKMNELLEGANYFFKDFERSIYTNYFYNHNSYKRFYVYFSHLPDIVRIFGLYQTTRLFFTIFLRRSI
jgi:glycosyltransferase involved in cell wall biosynthesis